MAKTKAKERALFYITQVPGPSKLFMHVYYKTEKGDAIIGSIGTQATLLEFAKALAKQWEPSTIFMQGKDAKWQEAFSYPPVRNKDER